ncbi:SBBP repeat-containing protein [Spirulina sp. 06S082]|uniref:SBBP repeat-containing protein n=1 Tax=Spirulina sp. 06S082 TaxID=3110248 RepID=UPI002B21547D|nr:SBBP repeat-containing protein [Spirulina sp. 06S082]MEA5467308.1 SBBP repeat-containing protein [Spirulina sp. 06S082]
MNIVIDWIKQLGTSYDDSATGVAVNIHGDIYISGRTFGNLSAGDSAGAEDAWLAKYDAQGNQVWIRQIGTTRDDSAAGIALDRQSNIYITGRTFGAISQKSHNSDEDAWLAKFSPQGQQLWIEQIGSVHDNSAEAIATDSENNIYITGRTFGCLDAEKQILPEYHDVWLAKYNTCGRQLWVRQLGSLGADRGYGVATDRKGNVYLTGNTTGILDTENGTGGLDAWLAKCDPDGNKLWIRQLGSASGYDSSAGVATDSEGNIAIAGYTSGTLDAIGAAGYYDAWVAKYNTNGDRLWIRQLGSSSYSYDAACGVATDSENNIYLTGNTSGVLEAGKRVQGMDIWVAKYDTLGNRLWVKQLGSSGYDGSSGVAIDPRGYIYITGKTSSDIEKGKAVGGEDAWIAKLHEEKEHENE